MTPLAWGPVAGGRLRFALEEGAPPPPETEAKAGIIARLKPVLADVAQAYGVTPLAIVMAWLMRHPSKIIPIVGTVRTEAMRDAAKADDITLDRDSWYRILRAARGKKLD
jgi:predicted oxidoreductase